MPMAWSGRKPGRRCGRRPSPDVAGAGARGLRRASRLAASKRGSGHWGGAGSLRDASRGPIEERKTS